MSNPENNQSQEGALPKPVVLKRLASGIAHKLFPPSTFPTNAPGDFSIDGERCRNFQICLKGSMGMLGRGEADNRKITYVVRQPITQEEFDTAVNFTMNCPLDAITYKGVIAHPEILERSEELSRESSQQQYLQEEREAQSGPLPDCG